MQTFLSECVLVEGKDDQAALANVVDALIFASHGRQQRPELEKTLNTLGPRLGLIIFTDPDGPGRKIRQHYQRLYPYAKHAELKARDCRHKRSGRLGVAYAKPELLLRALQQAGARLSDETPNERYPIAFLWEHGLSSAADSRQRRKEFCQALSLGELDSRQLWKVLNSGAFSSDEVRIALLQMDGGPSCL